MSNGFSLKINIAACQVNSNNILFVMILMDLFPTYCCTQSSTVLHQGLLEQSQSISDVYQLHEDFPELQGKDLKIYGSVNTNLIPLHICIFVQRIHFLTFASLQYLTLIINIDNIIPRFAYITMKKHLLKTIPN